MNAVVDEWIAKAEGDYHTARRELVVPNAPNFDAVCFHAQQCIEKLVKAALILQGELPPKTHDLTELFRLIRPPRPGEFPAEDLRFLTRAAADFRYPGEAADQDEATQAVEICARLRERLSRIIRDTAQVR